MDYTNTYKLWFSISMDGYDKEFSEEFMLPTLREVSGQTNWETYEDSIDCPDSTWYDYESGLIEFSKTHPSFLFEVDIEGEDRFDFLKLFVMDGVALFKYPKKPWDREELKECKRKVEKLVEEGFETDSR